MSNCDSKIHESLLNPFFDKLKPVPLFFLLIKLIKGVIPDSNPFLIILNLIVFGTMAARNQNMEYKSLLNYYRILSPDTVLIPPLRYKSSVPCNGVLLGLVISIKSCNNY